MLIGQIRQGDVLLIPVDQTPPEGLRGAREVVLALGELTGHAHRLQATQAGEVLEWNVDGQRYVRVIGPTPGSLVHEDHDPIPAPVVAPDVTYRIVQQQEWDLKGQWHKVQD